MKVVLATPLYPPDIAPPAPYIKELATRLREWHDVHIITYGHTPEVISGVTIEAVNKRRRKVPRLISFTKALYRNSKQADVLFVENGLSVELPSLLCSFILKTPIVFHIGDVSANAKSQKRFLPRLIQGLLKKRSFKTISAIPMERPEILPFGERVDLKPYEHSWNEHVIFINQTFLHV
jgi:hypothetical protein